MSIIKTKKDLFQNKDQFKGFIQDQNKDLANRINKTKSKALKKMYERRIALNYLLYLKQ